MAKLTEYQNPVSGDRGDLLNITTWKNLVLGAAVLSFVFGLSQYLVGLISGKIAVAKQFATTPFVDRPDTVIIGGGRNEEFAPIIHQ